MAPSHFVLRWQSAAATPLLSAREAAEAPANVARTQRAHHRRKTIPSPCVRKRRRRCALPAQYKIRRTSADPPSRRRPGGSPRDPSTGSANAATSNSPRRINRARPAVVRTPRAAETAAVPFCTAVAERSGDTAFERAEMPRKPRPPSSAPCAQSVLENLLPPRASESAVAAALCRRSTKQFSPHGIPPLPPAPTLSSR